MPYDTYLEDYIFRLYDAFGWERCPSLEAITQQLGLILVSDAPASYLRGNILLLATNPPWYEREDFAHELAHFLHDHGEHMNLPSLLYDYTERKADNFMYHFCVPSFFLERDDLPFCRKQAIQQIMVTYEVSRSLATKRLDMYEQKLLAQYENGEG